MEIYLHVTLFVLFQVCLIIQLYFLIARHNKLSVYIATTATAPATAIATATSPATNLTTAVKQIPISVIISARNEAKNISENLQGILKQDHPDFEVVVINDCSSDASEEILEEYQKTYPNLKIVTITEHERFKTGKKFALTLGIKAAVNEHLLFTDADCRPASSHWISCMAANFNSSSTQIVLGYSPYTKTRNFLNAFIRFETLKTAINYLSAALNGDAYMGIGRNLAYTKTLFFSAKGFAAHMHVISGDDDLFVNQNAMPDNTVIEIHPDAFVYTQAKTNLSSWFRQKKRHMGVGKLYRSQHRRFLSLDAISGFAFYILLTLCLVFNYEPWLMLGFFVIRAVLQLFIYNKLFKKLDGKDLLWYLPLFDIVYYIYLNVFGLIGTFIKTTKWK